MIELDSNLINSFILAVEKIFYEVAEITLAKESVAQMKVDQKVTAEIATIIGITGSLKGQCAILIDETIAMKFASAILMGEPVNEYNDLAESGVCEMVNMIAGDASRRLQKLGFICDISTPSVVKGGPVEITFFPRTPVFNIHFSSEWGPIQIILTLEAKKAPL